MTVLCVILRQKSQDHIIMIIVYLLLILRPCSHSKIQIIVGKQNVPNFIARPLQVVGTCSQMFILKHGVTHNWVVGTVRGVTMIAIFVCLLVCNYVEHTPANI